MGKKKKAPDYATTSYNTGGLFGSTTANKNGINYKPENWMSNTMGTVGGNLNNTLSSMVNNDFMTDPNFLRYQDQFNKQMAQAYDTGVLSQLANRGLMRSSGLQGATNAFADTLANNQLALYDNYYNRQANNLANLLNTSNALYDYMTGINSLAANHSNNVSNYNMSQWKVNSNLNPSFWERLSNMSTGAVQGAQAGSSMGPWGALGGSIAGSVGGALSGQKSYSTNN